MKKCLIIVVNVLLFQMLVFAQNALTLDMALSNSTSYLRGRIPAGSKVLVLNFTSNWTQLSEYIVEELIGYIVNEGALAVVDRRNLDVIQQEMAFQLSGEVSDETAQSIGKKLGAQTIISGSIVAVGDMYRLRIRAISVETAQIQGMQNVDVRQDSRIGALTGTGYSVPAISFGNNISGNTSAKIIPNANGLIVETDESQGGGSTGKVSLNREVIEGEERTVINMELTLNRGYQSPWGCILISDSGIMKKVKAASGIKFSVYGDGKRWYLEFATREAATDYAFYRGTINTRRNKIVTINIPYTSLRQPSEWGRRVGFNKNSIYQLQFSRANKDGLGISSIKVFDIEFY
ncbi:MAG: CsgG/HfaB family protein [Treponema sp.]|jgi:TolB-like protein|nr:CsgG/HfaB family protein [Treponema sp.]